MRDTERLAAGGSETSPAGRFLALWRAFAERPPRLDAAGLAAAAALLDLPPDLDWRRSPAPFNLRSRAAACRSPRRRPPASSWRRVNRNPRNHARSRGAAS
ncbi:DUF1403 family protein [Methylosinus sp. Sm6]|nr:DUF1403 family protein [Methylosinus sp. Sm6]